MASGGSRRVCSPSGSYLDHLDHIHVTGDWITAAQATDASYWAVARPARSSQSGPSVQQPAIWCIRSAEPLPYWRSVIQGAGGHCPRSRLRARSYRSAHQAGKTTLIDLVPDPADSFLLMCRRRMGVAGCRPQVRQSNIPNELAEVALM